MVVILHLNLVTISFQKSWTSNSPAWSGFLQFTMTTTGQVGNTTQSEKVPIIQNVIHSYFQWKINVLWILSINHLNQRVHSKARGNSNDQLAGIIFSGMEQVLVEILSLYSWKWQYRKKMCLKNTNINIERNHSHSHPYWVGLWITLLCGVASHIGCLCMKLSASWKIPSPTCREVLIN